MYGQSYTILPCVICLQPIKHPASSPAEAYCCYALPLQMPCCGADAHKDCRAGFAAGRCCHCCMPLLAGVEGFDEECTSAQDYLLCAANKHGTSSSGRRGRETMAIRWAISIGINVKKQKQTSNLYNSVACIVASHHVASDAHPWLLNAAICRFVLVCYSVTCQECNTSGHCRGETSISPCLALCASRKCARIPQPADNKVIASQKCARIPQPADNKVISNIDAAACMSGTLYARG